ncbi:MAG: hypothetical protein JWP74_252 [Marmoricola sp.]|nr:hypothetical protein [Marmoricola sp.]
MSQEPTGAGPTSPRRKQLLLVAGAVVVVLVAVVVGVVVLGSNGSNGSKPGPQDAMRHYEVARTCEEVQPFVTGELRTMTKPGSANCTTYESGYKKYHYTFRILKVVEHGTSAEITVREAGKALRGIAGAKDFNDKQTYTVVKLHGHWRVADVKAP